MKGYLWYFLIKKKTHKLHNMYDINPHLYHNMYDINPVNICEHIERTREGRMLNNQKSLLFQKASPNLTRVWCLFLLPLGRCITSQHCHLYPSTYQSLINWLLFPLCTSDPELLAGRTKLFSFLFLLSLAQC